jgi:hypothetical protein
MSILNLFRRVAVYFAKVAESRAARRTVPLNMRLSREFLKEMQNLLGRPDLTREQLVREALTALRHLAKERSAGLEVLTGYLEPKPVAVGKLRQPILDKVPVTSRDPGLK